MSSLASGVGVKFPEGAPDFRDRGRYGIAALSAAIANRDSFTIEALDQTSFHVTLGANAESYRGSLVDGQTADERSSLIIGLLCVSQNLVARSFGA